MFKLLAHDLLYNWRQKNFYLYKNSNKLHFLRKWELKKQRGFFKNIETSCIIYIVELIAAF